MTKFNYLLSVLTLGIAASTANASIVINTDQSASGSLGTVMFQKGDVGTTILGTTDSGAKLRFTGNETLVTSASGQATLGAQDGSFSFLDISFLNGETFHRLVFNLDSAVATTVNVTGYDQSNNVYTASIALSANGQNFINVLAIDNQRISRVVLSNDILTEMRQVRVGGVQVSAVPEPATMSLLGFALGGVALLRKFRSSSRTAGSAARRVG